MQPVRFEVIKLGGGSMQACKLNKLVILILFTAGKTDMIFTGRQIHMYIKSFAIITETE